MRRFSVTSFTACTIGLLSSGAIAQAPGQPAGAASAPSGDAAVFSSEESPFAVNAISDETLGAIAGREDTTQISHANQVAGVSRNSIGDNSATGNVRIADNAFQNTSGLSILNVNTGNNVAINAAMNVNVSIAPGQ